MSIRVRIFSHFLFVALAIGCVLVGALWVRSKLFEDSINWFEVGHHGPHFYQREAMLMSGDGQLRFQYWQQSLDGIFPLPLSDEHRLNFFHGRPAYHDEAFTVLGIGFERSRVFRILRIKYWLIFAALCASLLQLRLAQRRRIRGRRGLNGQCLNCGYDMRGGQSVCPECGTASVTEDPKENRTVVIIL